MAGETKLTRNALVTAATMQLVAHDVACMLFPHSGSLPNEELQASVRKTLYKLVGGIESALGLAQNEGAPFSWELLCSSGLLREIELVDFCLARIAETRIRNRLDQSPKMILSQLPVRLLQHENPLIVDMAGDLLSAESECNRPDAMALISQLPPVLLHLLAWRVVAVLKTLQVNAVQNGMSNVEQACRRLLSNPHRASLQTASAKLVYFLPDELREQLSDPAQSGLSLFVSQLSACTSVPVDAILRIIDGEAIEPLLVILRACGHDSEAAPTLLFSLRGVRVSDRRISELMADYDDLSVAEAAAMCLSWCAPNADISGVSN